MLAGMPRNTMAATLMLSPGPSQRLGLVVTQSRPSLRNQGRQKPPKILTVPGDFWPFSGDSLQMHVPTWLKNNWLYSLKWCPFNFWIRPPSLAYCIAYGACAVGSASHFSQRELKSSVVFCHAHAFKLPWTCRPWGCASKKKGPTVFGWVPDPPASSPPHSPLGSRTCQVRSPAVEWGTWARRSAMECGNPTFRFQSHREEKDLGAWPISRERKSKGLPTNDLYMIIYVP